MAETISKHIGEGFGKGELYAALAYDSGDVFGGMKIKSIMHNEDEKAYFRDANAYIYSSATGVLDIVATTVNITGDIGFTGVYSMGTMDVGIAVTTAAPFAFEVHTEPLTTLVAGDTGLSSGIRSRYHVTVAQANQISISAIDARLRVKHALADGVHCGINAGIEASTATADFTGTATTQRCAGHFYLDFDELGSLADNGWLTGITIDSSVHVSLSIAAVQFAGLRIKKSSGKLSWEQGIIIDDSCTGTAIDIGTVTGYAINFSGDEGRILMGASTSSRASFAATGDVAQFFTVNMATTGICTGLDFEHSLGYQGNTAMQATAIRGVLRILTGATINGTSKVYEGAAGYFMNEGTVNSASIDVTGVRGVIMDGGVWTAARNVACGWFDWQLNNALAGITNTSILLLTNNANQGAENPDNVMYLFTPYMKYLLNFQEGSATGGEIIAAGGSGGATRSYKIKCKYGDTEFWLSGYTD